MTLTLLLRYWRELGIAVLALGLVGACHQRDQAIRAQGVATERMRVADSTLTALRPQLARVDTIYRRDTIRLTRTRTHYDTLRESVIARIHDTTEVVRFVAAADTAIHACVEALHTCEAKQALLSTERDAWKAKALAIPVTTRGHSILVDLGLIAISGTVGYYAHRH